jgi:hypothetical protein
MTEEGRVFADELFDWLMRIIRDQSGGGHVRRASSAPVWAREEAVARAQPFGGSNDFMTFQLEHGQAGAEQTFRLRAALPGSGIWGCSMSPDGFEATVQIRQSRPRLLRGQCGSQWQERDGQHYAVPAANPCKPVRNGSFHDKAMAVLVSVEDAVVLTTKSGVPPAFPG